MLFMMSTILACPLFVDNKESWTLSTILPSSRLLDTGNW